MLNIRTNKSAKSLLILILFAILIQGWFVNSINFIGPQDAGYLNIARTMFTSDVITAAEKELTIDYVDHSPLYVAVCGFVYFLTGDIDGALKICYLFFSVILLVSIFLISLRLYERETAIISSFLVLFLPALSVTIYYAMRHVIFISLLYLSLYFILKAYLDKRIRYYSLGGLALGLAYMTRGEGLVIFIAVLIVCILTSIFEERRFNKEFFKRNIIFVFCFILFYLTQSLLIYNSTGDWGMGGRKDYQYAQFIFGQAEIAGIKDASGSGTYEYGHQLYGTGEENNFSIFNAIKRNPSAYMHRLIGNYRNLLYEFSSPPVFPFFLLPFVGIALIELLKNHESVKAHILFFAIIIAMLSLLIFIFNVQTRHLTPIVPIMIMWSAYGIKKTQDTLRGKGFTKFAYLPSVVIILSLSIMFFTYTKSIAAAIPRETKAIGEWIKSNTSVSDLVIVPKGWFDERIYLQYYSKRKVRNHSSASEGSILMLRQGQGEELPAHKVDYTGSDNEDAIIDSYIKDLIPTEIYSFKVKDQKIVVYEMR